MPQMGGNLVYFEVQSHTWQLGANGRLTWSESDANCIETGVQCDSCGRSFSFDRVDGTDEEHARVVLRP